MKRLRVTFSSGETYDIPAKVIAEHRARHYADIDPDTTFEREVSYALGDDYELKDWATGSMNWSDVSLVAVKVKHPTPIDLADEWANADKGVVDD